MDGFNLDRCNSIYQKANIQLNEKQLCAGSVKGKESCITIDSGSPLMGKINFSLIF